MNWPNNPEWCALRNDSITISGDTHKLSTVDCGLLSVPSGQLVCCDPFAGMSMDDNSYVEIPPGKYPVVVTLADVSPELDGSHFREAYASLLIGDPSTEVSRKFLIPLYNGEQSDEELDDGEFWGFGVDAGTACFVDAQAIKTGMPPEEEWDQLFDNDTEESWFNLMDSEEYLCDGLANIALPLSKNGDNLILFNSGWGDGCYPVIGGYDKNGNLVAVHIDFFVIGDDELDSDFEADDDE